MALGSSINCFVQVPLSCLFKDSGARGTREIMHDFVSAKLIATCLSDYQKLKICCSLINLLQISDVVTESRTNKALTEWHLIKRP